MTTNRRWAGRIGAAVLTLAVLIAAWTVIGVAAARLGEFETLMVIAPSDGFLNSLPHDIAFSDAGRHVLVLRSDRPDFAAELYAAGAALVLPARERGCLAVLAR